MFHPLRIFVTPRFSCTSGRSEHIPEEFDQNGVNVEAEDQEDVKEGIKDGLQTFIFSATLSKDLQRNVKKKFRPKGNKKHYKRDQAPATTLGRSLFAP
jgi:ATP-dependent RNA helicase DDX24/MAK5